MPKPIPDGFTAITPYLVIPDVAKEIEFMQNAFDAKVENKMPGPGGAIFHAEMSINGARVMMGMSSDKHPPMGAMLYVYVPDCDAVFAKAIAAGASVVYPCTDMFYGDRCGGVKDPNGVSWGIGTHKEDLTPEQIQQRMATQMKPKT